jgi:delta 1-pyrroline-5-carboxylate dehydrogenase
MLQSSNGKQSLWTRVRLLEPASEIKVEPRFIYPRYTSLKLIPTITKILPHHTTPHTAAMSPSAVTSDGHTASGTTGLNNGRSDLKHEPLTWTNFSNIIDGKLETTKETHCGINPATEQSNPSVPVASKDDVDKAMSAAQKAFKPWAAEPYAARQKAVLAFADGLEAEKEAFSKFLTQEQGKPASLQDA